MNERSFWMSLVTRTGHRAPPGWVAPVTRAEKIWRVAWRAVACVALLLLALHLSTAPHLHPENDQPIVGFILTVAAACAGIYLGYRAWTNRPSSMASQTTDHVADRPDAD